MKKRSYPKLSENSPRLFGDWIRNQAWLHGDTLALEICGDSVSYADIDHRSDLTATGFAAMGLRTGEHVALMMETSTANIDTWFGLQKAGLVEVPVHTASRGLVLEHIVHNTDARAMVIDAAFLPLLVEVVDRLPKLQHLIVNHDSSVDTDALPSRIEVHDLADLYLEGNTPQPEIDHRSPAVILHTSGTTGPPKGVVISHEAALHLVRRTVWLMEYTSDDRLYTAFPLFHQNAKYTSVCAAMECGGSLIMERRFSASRFWDLCREKNITAFNYMGALLMMLYKQPERPDDADNPVRVAFGAPCPAEIWEEFEHRFGLQLVEVYGMTESPLACENRLEYRRIGSAGKESDTYHVRIVDEMDNPVPPDTPGEIVVRPKLPWVLFTEYYKRPADTVEAWRNLWFHTGDRGRMDADGYLYFIDRMKDCIRRRGENISSWEIENTVNTHPSVLESAAYGMASELTESEVMIAVVLRPGLDLSPAELISFCKAKMTRFAVPRYVRFCEELPKNTSGRIQKFKLREQGITADTWDNEARDQ